MGMGRGRGLGGGSWKLRIGIAVVIALVTFVSYMMNTSSNPITGESQRVGGMLPENEVQLGLAAAPEMAAQFGGAARNAAGQAQVERVGQRLVAALHEVYDVAESPYPFTFTLLEDDDIVNAFALPGGPTYITEALYNRLESEGQLAGVMGHEIGHVIHRHGAQRMAQQNLSQGLVQSVTMAAGDISAGQVASMVGNFVMMSYGRDQELECDAEGIKLMVVAGYDPRSMAGVMKILAEASGGGGGTPEWASTHPDPGNRIERIEAIVAEMFPDGVPEHLEP